MRTEGFCDRLSERHEVLLRARCRKSSWHVFAVELSDISEGGCCIVGNAEDFEPGQSVALRIAHLKAIPAHVRWIRESRVGIEFLSPLGSRVIGDLDKAYGIRGARKDTLSEGF
ncbi:MULTISPECIES: PilZ domain-containing protein [Novosphingobium]|uniref:PilZ domain-containing protein n=1 Tax=Novosphingobium sp. TaxID=1874826 RepID=UPI0012D15CA6|nr:PilZ domain-containing protein [Novosphingobium sp.]MPS69204.1 PilZ domain-containing protein [Novosphingobium sp.]